MGRCARDRRFPRHRDGVPHTVEPHFGKGDSGGRDGDRRRARYGGGREGVRFAFIFFVIRHHLDDILDGIVFGAVVGAGFAWLEDIFYVLGAAAEGVEAMGLVFVLRVFVFGLNHAFFTALAGLGFGVVKVVRSCWLGGLAWSCLSAPRWARIYCTTRWWVWKAKPASWPLLPCTGAAFSAFW
ncbi:MAG: PrsW family intramembrane metalloprotease [candidate division Zixibacteria bacterium]|nr:PrsW family intramembrane metalloprotease [candidate division Zixibacteria bacterium]